MPLLQALLPLILRILEFLALLLYLIAFLGRSRPSLGVVADHGQLEHLLGDAELLLQG